MINSRTLNLKFEITIDRSINWSSHLVEIGWNPFYKPIFQFFFWLEHEPINFFLLFYQYIYDDGWVHFSTMGFLWWKEPRKGWKFGKKKSCELWRCEKTCESTWRRWDLLLERGPFLFLFRHRVPNNAHVIELGIRSCTLQNMQRCHCIPSFPWSSFRAHAQQDGQGSNGYWAGTRLLGHLVGQVPTPAVPILHVKLELELEPWYNF